MTDTKSMDALIRQKNLRRAWALKDEEQWTAAQIEQLAALAFEEWDIHWREEITREA